MDKNLTLVGQKMLWIEEPSWLDGTCAQNAPEVGKPCIKMSPLFHAIRSHIISVTVYNGGSHDSCARAGLLGSQPQRYP